MAQAVVEVSDLSRSFGGKAALAGVAFRASTGQVHGLVGSNGAGKTTLLKHVLGLFRATTGSVRVFGLDPVRDPVRVLGRIGYLSEERELPEWMRVEELMRYTQAFHPTWDVSYERELLETFALDPAKKVRDLSKGMRVLTARYLGMVLLMSGACATACFTLLRAVDPVSVTDASSSLWLLFLLLSLFLVLPLLVASVLAPLALSRARHL